jgi:hypothetical protein
MSIDTARDSASDSMSHPDTRHPAPQRSRVSLVMLAIGLVGAPLAWSVQIVVGFAIAAYACYPQRMSLAAPVLAGLKGQLAALSIAAIVLAAICTFVAWRSWSRTRGEQAGDHHALLEHGEGRTRFMAMCGLLTSAGFLIVLLFTSVVLVFVQPCGL